MKLELKENMYVRTKDGYISQYKYYNTTNAYMEKLLCIPLNNGTFANIEDIVKASYNIIDILEVGDYVNGYKVEKVNNNLSEHKGICNSLDTYLWGINDLDEFEKIVIFENDIKSVVTKEEFESMKYRIEGE